MKLIDEILRERINKIADEYNSRKDIEFKINQAGIEEMLLSAKNKIIESLLSEFTDGQLRVLAFKNKNKKASKTFKEDFSETTPKDIQEAVEAAHGANRATLSDVKEFNDQWMKLPVPIKGRNAPISPSIKEKFRTRMKSRFFRENWKEGMEAMSTDPFCLGDNDRNWVADKAYFLKPDTLERLLNRKDARKSKSVEKKIPNQFK